MDGLLSGKLAYVFLVSIFDATLLALAALLWFRRSVQTLMRRRGQSDSETAATDHQQPGAGRAEPGVPAHLSFALFESAAEQATKGSPSTAPPIPLRRRLLVAYVLGAAAYSAVITTLQFAWEEPPLPWVAWLARWWENTWPLVPALAALLVLDRRATVRLVGWYLLIGVASVLLFTLAGQVLRGEFNTAPITNVYWMVLSLAWSVWLPLILILLSGWRRIRAVMPLALAGTLAFGFALMLFRELLILVFDLGPVRSVILELSALTSVNFVYYGLFLLMSLPVGVLAWMLLRGLAGSFERKRFSDVQLVVDCWWAIVAAEQAALLSNKLGLGAIAGAVAAFAAYRIIVALALRSRSHDGIGKRLLLLRVFGYQARTESLFDRLAQAWRFHGPVQLIAGVDLATRTADPGDMLKLLSGALDTQYVASVADVGTRMARLDYGRDPEGRFRVNDVYCHDDTWRSAVQALLDSSDCVLMDVRSFSQQNQGCVFELEQLLLRLPTESIVFVVDKSTDLRLLGATLERSWRSAREAGRAKGDGTIALVRVERNSAAELSVLMRRLSGLGEPHRVLSQEELREL
ncbi:MAG: hypothetical protein ABWY07_14190 [Burkholderiales bacterium]